jgi:hypothetical protein
MRLFIAVVAVAAFASVSALAESGPGPMSPPPGKLARVCLRPFDTPGPAAAIHTHVVDPQTILFYERGGKVWKNTLRAPCPGLMFHGFDYVTHQDEICSNAQSIRVIETGEVCELGDFVPYTPPPTR